MGSVELWRGRESWRKELVRGESISKDERWWKAITRVCGGEWKGIGGGELLYLVWNPDIMFSMKAQGWTEM